MHRIIIKDGNATLHHQLQQPNRQTISNSNRVWKTISNMLNGKCSKFKTIEAQKPQLQFHLQAANSLRHIGLFVH